MKYKSREKKKQDLIRGKRAEKEYAKVYSDSDVIFSEGKVDWEEHWDVMINGVKIDVKAIKKENENIHFIEFKNVLGKKGWLYGDADGFAFETKDFWVEVRKEDLQEWVHDKCVDKVNGWDVYELGSRPNTEDLFTTVPTLDLCFIGKIKKKV